MTGTMPRAVFDCNVVFQAVIGQGPAFRCVELVETKSVEPLISQAILEEYRDVFARPKLIARFPQLAPERLAMFLRRLVIRATLIEQVPHVIDLSRDPKDEPYLDLAVAGKADYLVSRDKDLLSFASDQPVQFRQYLPGLKIVDPVVFIQDLKAQP
jgi:putative PIN family toxin of toxin-antitoxin system